MKKEKIIQKTRDQILWEDFVAKNNIKKNFKRYCNKIKQHKSQSYSIN